MWHHGPVSLAAAWRSNRCSYHRASAGRRSPMAKHVLRMSRARTKLEPGERLLLAARPHPAALLPALLRALGVLLAVAVILALLAQSSAPDSVRKQPGEVSSLTDFLDAVNL